MKCLFIGIDHHADAGIPDLTGAVRDARALASLFEDSIPDMDSICLVDDEANHLRIVEEISGLLGSAAADETVVVVFAGHGTRDHRLVAVDTEVDRLEDTTLSMADLALWFKESSAQAVICVLDCCFSGGAAARVLDVGLTSRSTGVVLAPEVLGNGRVMITASGLSEAAYEDPMRRHGLLSAALIDVLTEIDEATPALEVFSSAQDRVRARAAGLSRTQNPVVFGLTEGGLTFPPLKAGSRYYGWFPEAGAGPRVSSFDDIESLGVPKHVCDQWAARFPSGLNELQLAAINEHRVLRNGSLLTIAPTSAGKTFVGELAALRSISDGKKVTFLLPYRALVNEKFEEFSEQYGGTAGLRIIRCSGDYLDDTGAFLRGRYEIAFLTYEMFLALSVGNDGVLPRIGLVVLDEAQFISDPHRGITVELILTYLRAVKDRGIAPQLILLSATIGEPNSFDDWLGISVLRTTQRPVPLEVGVLDRAGTFQYADEDGETHVEQLLAPGAVRQSGPKARSRDVLVPLLGKLLGEESDPPQKVLVFRNVRGATQGSAIYLAQELGLPPAHDVASALTDSDPSRTTQALKRALDGGTAFHNSNLTREERSLIEGAFRDPHGPVRVLTATATVAAGVNTPASTVVIAENGYPWANQRYTVGEVNNMAGRAGRTGLQETGRAIMLASNAMERERLFRDYVLADPEPVRSSFEEGAISTWLLRLLAQVTPPETAKGQLAGGVRKSDVPAIIVSTYGGFLRARGNPNWTEETRGTVSALVDRLLDLGLVEHLGDEDTIALSLLGRAVAESPLALDSAVHLIELVRATPGTLAPESLLVLVQALPEMDATFTPLFKKGTRESKWPGALSTRIDSAVVGSLQERAWDSMTYYARAKRACILLDWIEGVPTEVIEERYSVNPYNAVAYGDIRSIADTTRFYLRSAGLIATIVDPAIGSDGEGLEEVLERMELGVPALALLLLRTTSRLTRGHLLTLLENGVATVEELDSLDSKRLEELLGPATATELRGPLDT